MRKSISIIAAAAMTASIGVAGAVNTFATETPDATQAAAETVDPTEAPAEPATEAPAEPATDAPAEPATDAPAEPVVTEPATEPVTAVVTAAPTEAAATGITEEQAKEKAIADAGKGGEKYFVVDSYYSSEGYYVIKLHRQEGTKRLEYHVSDTLFICIDPDAATAVTTAAAPAVTGAAATAKTTATTKATGAATSGAAASKTNSPKTGVAFPAIAATGLAISAVAVAFTFRKKED